MNEQIDKLFTKLKVEAEASGYHLNPNLEDVMYLVSGLQQNLHRYGYLACPCRLATGEKAMDLDIVCPCDYRDDDLNDYNTCYCGLYVGDKVLHGDQSVQSIPERRNSDRQKEKTAIKGNLGTLTYPVYRCKVCGYLCARNNPPGTCPICKTGAERFERIL